MNLKIFYPSSFIHLHISHYSIFYHPFACTDLKRLHPLHPFNRTYLKILYRLSFIHLHIQILKCFILYHPSICIDLKTFSSLSSIRLCNIKILYSLLSINLHKSQSTPSFIIYLSVYISKYPILYHFFAYIDLKTLPPHTPC